MYTVLFILWPWYGNLFSGPGTVLVLVLVLKEKVLVLILTKKSWSWSWSWKNMEVLVLVLTKKSYLHHWPMEVSRAATECHTAGSSCLRTPKPSRNRLAAGRDVVGGADHWQPVPRQINVPRSRDEYDNGDVDDRVTWRGMTRVMTSRTQSSHAVWLLTI